MPAPPLRTSLQQLALERVGASWVAAQTSGGLTETHQLVVRHLAQTLAQFFKFVAGFDCD
jgi:hypothetical protein